MSMNIKLWLISYYNGREREEVEKIFEKTMSVDNIQIKFNKEINNIFLLS